MVDKLTRKRSVPVHESDGKMRPMCGATLCDEERVTRWKDMVTCTACLGIRTSYLPTGIEVVKRPLGYYVKLPNVWAGEIGLNEQEATELHLLLGSALNEKRDADRDRTELPGAALSDASRGGREDKGQDRAPEARTGNASLPTMGDARRSEDRTSDRGLGMAGSSGGTAAVAVHTCPAGSVSLFHDCGGCIAAFREGGSKRDYPWRTPDGNASMVTDRGERQAQASPNACAECEAGEGHAVTDDPKCPALVAAIQREASPIASSTEPVWVRPLDAPGAVVDIASVPPVASPSSCEATIEACAKVADEVGQDTLARRIRAMVKAP